MEPLTFVDVATARAARGLRLAVLSTLPSPWSESAKGLFRVRGVPVLAVRFRRDDSELSAWTRARNVPVALYDDEPPRTGWADILALAERLGNPAAAALVPAEPELRVRLHGLAHELASEGGLGWSERLIMIDGSIASEGARSFPLPVARYLAPLYGYGPDRVTTARARLRSILALFEEQLSRSQHAGSAYLLGDSLTALDIYLATFLTPIVGVSQSECPGLRPEVAHAFDYLREQPEAQISAAMAAHRELVFRRHLAWPIQL